MEIYILLGILVIIIFIIGMDKRLFGIKEQLKESNKTLDRIEDSLEEKLGELKDEIAGLGGDVARIEEKLN